MSQSARLLAVFVFALVLWQRTAVAQGTLIVPEPRPHPRIPGRLTTTPLDLKSHRVTTEITDGVAVTNVQQIFRNPLDVPIEGTYVFLLPAEAAVGDFSMTMNGTQMRGEVLDKQRARATYESIVRQARDPALLELLERQVFRASIAPIPAGGQFTVELKFSQTLSEQGGLGSYIVPLRPIAGGDASLDELAVQVKLRSQQPLTSVFCPTHAAAVSRASDREALVSFEQTTAKPDRDLVVYYQRRDAQFGMCLLTHRQPGEAGYFMFRISPRIEAPAAAVLPKDILFVIDTSGSMKGDKIEQARRALRFCIQSLNPHDRFNILSFSIGVQSFRESLALAEPAVRDSAVEFTNKLEAVGGTNINQALLDALANDPRDPERPFLVVFLTDGQPTVDVTDPAKILANVAEKNARNVRMHVFGVGSDVNTHLLDKLAENTRGTRDYCTEREDLELKLSAFVGRLANPLLTDIRLLAESLAMHDVYPRAIPDLFRGGEIVVLGRYETSGTHTVRIEARGAGAERLEYSGEFPAQSAASDFLPRLWAHRKVAYLLDEIRLHGQTSELVDEVVRLATRHGIVTPYTAALIVEDESRVTGGGGLAMREQARQLAADAPAASGIVGGRGGRKLSGDDAVAGSLGLKASKSAEALKDDESAETEAGHKQIRHAADKTFLFAEGRYVDSAWDGKSAATPIEAFSDAYFALLKEHPHAAQYLAIGEHILIVLGERVYEIRPAK